jgi:energy-coupling factor transport system substrate-specific component
VSWQLGAFSLLGVALVAGFTWYERSRPDARIVALVGTLAAFAALGRIAFAAVPNVKPTTDIVLIAGYALGSGPGFAVGALAGLTSNFFFGQGPWTPWQMAAWGATGVLGAALAWLTTPRTRQGRRTDGQPRIGRWPLAIICCAAGFAFTAFQDVGDWVTYSDHSVAQLGVYVGQGLGFDAIHAGGCLVFALAFGPALIRSIQRFARRLQVTWIPASPASPARAARAAAPLLAIVCICGFVPGLGAPAPARAASASLTSSVDYLLRAENPDGGFGGAPGQISNQLYSGWAALGLAAAGQDPYRVARNDHGLIGYVRAGPSLTDPGSLERTILVIRAAGLSAVSFGGHDLLAALERDVRADGSVSRQVNWTAFAVLALRAAGVAPAARTFSWLVHEQDRDGGFSFAGAGGQSDVDDTGATLEALAGRQGTAAGRARTRAVAYLRRQQDRDGGFPSQPGQGSNAQSTAWAIQGLDAVGVSPTSLHRGGAVSPLAYLEALVQPNGSVRYSRGLDQSPVWVTGEALMALEGKPLPLAPGPAPTSSHPAPATHPAPRSSSHHAHPAHAPRSSRHTSRRVRRDRASVSPGPLTGPMLRISAGAGLLTALILAPVGLG